MHVVLIKWTLSYISNDVYNDDILRIHAVNPPTVTTATQNHTVQILKTVKSQELGGRLSDFANISYADARWVPGAGGMVKAENDWRDGRPQVAVQRYLPPFLGTYLLHYLRSRFWCLSRLQMAYNVSSRTSHSSITYLLT